MAEARQVGRVDAKILCKTDGGRHDIQTGGSEPVDEDHWWSAAKGCCRLPTEYVVAAGRSVDVRQFSGQRVDVTVSWARRWRDGRVVDGGGLENH